MKRIRVSILALSALAGGILAASAANVTTYTAYNLNVQYTNAAAAAWEVSGAPATTGTNLPKVFQYVTAQTDGSGKITGGGVIFIYETTNAVPVQSVLYVQATGTIGNKTVGAAPTVTLAMKGTGFTLDGVGGAVPTSATLKFTGTLVPGVTNSAGQPILSGTLSGNIMGIGSAQTLLDPKNAKVSIATVIDNSSFNFDSPQGDVLQALKNGVPSSVQFWSDFATGNGTIKSGTNYTVKFAGIGMEKGLSGTLTGKLGPYTNNIGASAIVFQAPVTATLTAKDKGQKISGTGPQSISVSLDY